MRKEIETAQYCLRTRGNGMDEFLTGNAILPYARVPAGSRKANKLLISRARIRSVLTFRSLQMAPDLYAIPCWRMVHQRAGRLCLKLKKSPVVAQAPRHSVQVTQISHRAIFKWDHGSSWQKVERKLRRMIVERSFNGHVRDQVIFVDKAECAQVSTLAHAIAKHDVPYTRAANGVKRSRFASEAADSQGCQRRAQAMPGKANLRSGMCSAIFIDQLFRLWPHSLQCALESLMHHAFAH